jgi:hypothetical protein
MDCDHALLEPDYDSLSRPQQNSQLSYTAREKQMG